MTTIPIPVPVPIPDADAHGRPGSFTFGAAGIVWLSGTDRLPFLQRLSTNRVDDLAPGEGRSTLLLTDTGRVVDWVACHHAADGTVLITTHAASAPVVAAHLARYVLREAVRVTDATDQVIHGRLFGPGAGAVAAGLTGVAPDAAPGTFARRGEGSAMVWALAHTAPWPAGGWDIIVPLAATSEPVVSACAAHGLVPAAETDYTLQRIRCRAPMYGAEIDGTANPLELGLIDIVDFAKGCYVGQEVVARLDTYQKVRRRLVMITSDHALGQGDVLRPADATPSETRRRDGSGRVTSAAADGRGLFRAMALVPPAWGDGTGQTIVDPSGHPVQVVARVNPTPSDERAAAENDKRAAGDAVGA